MKYMNMMMLPELWFWAAEDYIGQLVAGVMRKRAGESG
jgi:hypothetical protein